MPEQRIRFDGKLSKRLYNQDGSPNNMIRVFLNGRDILFLDKKVTSLRDGDIVLLLPVLGGG